MSYSLMFLPETIYCTWENNDEDIKLIVTRFDPGILSYTRMCCSDNHNDDQL